MWHICAVIAHLTYNIRIVKHQKDIKMLISLANSCSCLAKHQKEIHKDTVSFMYIYYFYNDYMFYMKQL